MVRQTLAIMIVIFMVDTFAADNLADIFALSCTGLKSSERGRLRSPNPNLRPKRNGPIPERHLSKPRPYTLARIPSLRVGFLPHKPDAQYLIALSGRERFGHEIVAHATIGLNMQFRLRLLFG